MRKLNLIVVFSENEKECLMHDARRMVDIWV